jgi:hypothetical protein
VRLLAGQSLLLLLLLLLTQSRLPRVCPPCAVPRKYKNE